MLTGFKIHSTRLYALQHIFTCLRAVTGQRLNVKGQVKSQRSSQMSNVKSKVKGQVKGQRSKVNSKVKGQFKGQRSKVKRSKVKPKVKSKVKGQRSKVKGQRSKVKGQRSKVKGQRSSQSSKGQIIRLKPLKCKFFQFRTVYTNQEINEYLRYRKV